MHVKSVTAQMLHYDSCDLHSLPPVREGIALLEEGLSPYAGDIFHEVILLFYKHTSAVKY